MAPAAMHDICHIHKAVSSVAVSKSVKLPSSHVAGTWGPHARHLRTASEVLDPSNPARCLPRKHTSSCWCRSACAAWQTPRAPILWAVRQQNVHSAQSIRREVLRAMSRCYSCGGCHDRDSRRVRSATNLNSLVNSLLCPMPPSQPTRASPCTLASRCPFTSI
jgi:hypothetical protein